MKLRIHIDTGHINELGSRDLKKLNRALEIIVQTATGKIPKIEINAKHNTTKD